MSNKTNDELMDLAIQRVEESLHPDWKVSEKTRQKLVEKEYQRLMDNDG